MQTPQPPATLGDRPEPLLEDFETVDLFEWGLEPPTDRPLTPEEERLGQLLLQGTAPTTAGQAG